MEYAAAVKLGEVMEKAAEFHKSGDYVSFAQAVRFAFWGSFGKHEHNLAMQEVYYVLCDMGYPPAGL